MARSGARALLLAGLVVLTAWPGIASAASGVNISATESISFTGRVANIDSCVFSNATIDWGDGTSSAGQFDTGSTPGVKGTHTYAEEGTFNGSVTYTTDCTTNGKVTFTATVGDVALTASGRDIGPTAGQPFTGVVSHFTDFDPQGTASDYIAQIDWGDGSHSAGTVSAASGGGFDVTGTHTYQAAGDAAVNVTITDAGGSSATSSSAAHIALLPLTASFTVTPSMPCQGQPVTFDASGSTGGAQITTYRWNFNVGSNDPLTSGDQSGPTYKYPVLGSIISPADWWNHVGAEVHGYPTPVPEVVTLQVVDSGGRTAFTQQTLTPGNSDEIFVVHDNPVGWGWYVEDVYSLVPKYHGPCDSALRTQVNGVLASPASVLLDGTSSLTASMSCPMAAGDCEGTLIVLPPREQIPRSDRVRATAARHKTSPLRTLGRVGFFVPRGRTAKVKIPLNRAGRRLAQARRLKVVRLLVFSADGKAQTRKVRVRSSKH